MFREVEFDTRLLKYFRAEQNSPKWLKTALDTDDATDETFEAFCNRHRMFEIDDVALLYLEKKDSLTEIHFSMLRGAKCDLVGDLIEIRDMLFAEGTSIIYGWVMRVNRPLRRLCANVGLYFTGSEYGEGKGKKLCYAISRKDLYLPIKKDLLISF